MRYCLILNHLFNLASFSSFVFKLFVTGQGFAFWRASALRGQDLGCFVGTGIVVRSGCFVGTAVGAVAAVHVVAF
jgi:hypothetical protein